MAEIRLWHLQPFINSSVHFLIIVRSVNTSFSLTRHGQEFWVDGPEVPTEMMATCVQCVLCGGCTVMLNDHS